jgi:FAD/FMN-containing dehydrogenase
MARLHGLACDNLVSAEVATASGERVRASDMVNPDLFWGIRGGRGNFGIVTEFEFQLHPIGPVLSSQRRYAAEDALTILRAFREVMASAPRELCSLIGLQNARGAGELQGSGRSSARELYLSYAYARPDLDAGEDLGGLLCRVASPIAEQTEVMSYADLQSATGGIGSWATALLEGLTDVGAHRYFPGHVPRARPDRRCVLRRRDVLARRSDLRRKRGGHGLFEPGRDLRHARWRHHAGGEARGI